MKVYIEFLLLINFMYDISILLTVSSILKRNVSIKRLAISALIGSLTTFMVFFEITKIYLILLKLLIGIAINLIAYGFKDIKYFLLNILSFYSICLLLGGIVYYLNLEIATSKIAPSLINNNIKIEYLLILLLSPLSLIAYKRQIKELKDINNYYYKVDVYINDKVIRLNAFLDTANTLKDPITGKYVLVTNSKEVKKIVKNYYLIPYESINHKGLIKCSKVNKIYIENIGYKKNVVMAITNKKLKVNNVDTLLNYGLMKGR